MKTTYVVMVDCQPVFVTESSSKTAARCSWYKFRPDNFIGKATSLLETTMSKKEAIEFYRNLGCTICNKDATVKAAHEATIRKYDILRSHLLGFVANSKKVLVEEVQEKFGWSKKTVLRRASQLAEFGMIELQEDVLTTGENR
jgi:hypothetical protein